MITFDTPFTSTNLFIYHFRHKGHAISNLKNIVNRGETFITWPKQIAQKPAEMVASGFYYTGRGDVVQCFNCGIFLKHWTPADVAESEHAKHAPQCKYIKMFCCRK